MSRVSEAKRFWMTKEYAKMTKSMIKNGYTDSEIINYLAVASGRDVNRWSVTRIRKSMPKPAAKKRGRPRKGVVTRREFNRQLASLIKTFRATLQMLNNKEGYAKYQGSIA